MNRFRVWLDRMRHSWAESYTKRIVTLILCNAIIWVYCSYILAYLGRYEIAEDLSGKVVTVIISTIITYCLKALFEKVLPTDIKKFKSPKGEQHE